MTPPFVVNALINSFDGCAGTANITADRFYGESETITIRDHPITNIYTFIMWDGSYQSKKGGGGGTIDGYTFPVTVHNMDANAVDEMRQLKAKVAPQEGAKPILKSSWCTRRSR